MINFKTTIEKFGSKGEKTGWYYIPVSQDHAELLKPGCKKCFRVKGRLDDLEIEKVNLSPVGEGDFILAVNAAMRKALGKKQGFEITVILEEDKSELEINPELLECLADEPSALKFFNSLTPGHRRYFSNWIDSAKANETRTKRIALTITGLQRKMDYGEMIRWNKSKKTE